MSKGRDGRSRIQAVSRSSPSAASPKLAGRSGRAMFLGTPRSRRGSRSSAAKDRRTVEEPVRPVAKWVRISLDWRLCSALPTYSGQPSRISRLSSCHVSGSALTA